MVYNIIFCSLAIAAFSFMKCKCSLDMQTEADEITHLVSIAFFVLVLVCLELFQTALCAKFLLDAVDPFIFLLWGGGWDPVNHVISLHHSAISLSFACFNELSTVIGDIQLKTVLQRRECNHKSMIQPQYKISIQMYAEHLIFT